MDDFDFEQDWADVTGGNYTFDEISNNVDLSGLSGGGFDVPSLNLDDFLSELGGMGTDLGAFSDMGMSQDLLNQIGLGDNSDWENYGFADVGVGDVGTSGFYDEESGKFVPSAYGQLSAPLDEKSGTNAESMKDYTYDNKTGTWTTPDGQTYTPAIVPSGQAKSGAQVMVDAGALPVGYNGLKPNPNSTAGGNANNYKFNVGPDGKSLLDSTSTIDKKAVDAGIKGGTIATPGGTVKPGATTTKAGMDPSMMMMLMLLLSQMGKGGGGSSQSASIPQLSASRSALPYTAPSRPGAGGTTYFSPTTYAPRMAGGGMAMAGGGGISSLGSYSDGGRLLKGPGDGVSDNIPATIAGKQPARLANGEFVVPARIVSELGNGSTDAGAKRLYEMMDRVQKARRKTKNVAADTKARKYLPA
jgi:hypothetical protein